MTSVARPAGRADRVRVAAGRPRQERVAEHEHRRVLVQDEGAVGKLAELGLVEPVATGLGIDPLGVEPLVDRVGAPLAVQAEPERREPVVVRATAERARAMACRERRRLVEEEELGELARLQERRAMPVLEDETTGDPAPNRVAPPDPPGSSCRQPRFP